MRQLFRWEEAADLQCGGHSLRQPSLDRCNYPSFYPASYSVYYFVNYSPNPSLLTAEKIALTEALVILELTPTP